MGGDRTFGVRARSHARTLNRRGKELLKHPRVSKNVRLMRRSTVWTVDRLTRDKRMTLTALSLIAVGAALTYVVLLKKNSVAVTTSPTPGLVSQTGSLTKGTPDYDTVLPAGKTIADYGGWTRVSPPERNPVFAYADRIGNVPVIVSQQPLPKELQGDDTEHQVQQLAAGYKANETLSIGSTSVYVGTSAKGPQSIIFNRDGLLVLIKASAKLDQAALRAYVNSLE